MSPTPLTLTIDRIEAIVVSALWDLTSPNLLKRVLNIFLTIVDFTKANHCSILDVLDGLPFAPNDIF